MSGTAIVVGASIAGLAAARVLSDHYGSVVVLERDGLPDGSATRRGVPQGAHSHVLVAAGLREFERLLPGFRVDLLAAGGTAIDVGSELYLSRYNRAWPPAPSGVEFVSLSRPMLELILRDDRWLVGLVGWHVNDLSDDEASFIAAVRALPDPAIAQLLDRVQPGTDPVNARVRSNHRRLFERLDREPAGYVALGDAICSFNPFYGHGMTCAVQEAVALGSALRRHGRESVAMLCPRTD